MTEREDVDRMLASLRERTDGLEPPARLQASIVERTRLGSVAAISRLALPAAAVASLLAAALWLVVLERSIALEQVVASEALEGSWR